jgi:Brp/Blh family beta-carotene 15,15'-monooxygenase
VTVPPILAIGLYFCCWHALRHIGRLMVLDADARSLPFRWRDGVRRFVRDSAPLTVVSLLFMGLFFVGVGQVVGDSAEWPAVYLVLISALTLPHTLVVWWMDVRDGIWQSAPTALPAQHAADAAPTG